MPRNHRYPILSITSRTEPVQPENSCCPLIARKHQFTAHTKNAEKPQVPHLIDKHRAQNPCNLKIPIARKLPVNTKFIARTRNAEKPQVHNESDKIFVNFPLNHYTSRHSQPYISAISSAMLLNLVPVDILGSLYRNKIRKTRLARNRSSTS